MRQFLKIASAVFLVTLAIVGQSCKDDWNKHYIDEPAKAPDIRLADYIKSQPELSKFYEMLTITGYDTILNASQVYTVWAPTNNALQNVDLNSKSSVKDIVQNHITRFSYPSSGVQSDYVKMLNGKLIHFYRDNVGFYFGNILIKSPDVLTANGILHIMDSYLPFQANIWEYISRMPGLDSLKAYINSQNSKLFDLDRSIAIGIDSLGNTVYDSAFVETNLFFERMGELNVEDSIYTAILPDNTAWNDAYNRIKKYFVSNHPTQAAQIQRYFTKYVVAKDLVFRNRVKTPASLDSLVSTSGAVFYQPGYLFANAVTSEVSNGLVYVASQLQHKATDSWFSKIKVEAESSYGRSALNANIYLRYSYGSPMDVSQKGYIVVEPTTTSAISKVYVDFSIPNTLSAKYNIYCVFVPGTITNANDTKPNRAVFYLLKTGYDGIVTSQPLTVPNNVTESNGITKMVVAKNFSLPYCDMNLESTKDVAPRIKLRVQNDVSVKDTSFSRTMRIDYVLFEPVSE